MLETFFLETSSLKLRNENFEALGIFKYTNLPLSLILTFEHFKILNFKILKVSKFYNVPSKGIPNTPSTIGFKQETSC